MLGLLDKFQRLKVLMEDVKENQQEKNACDLAEQNIKPELVVIKFQVLPAFYQELELGH